MGTFSSSQGRIPHTDHRPTAKLMWIARFGLVLVFLAAPLLAASAAFDGHMEPGPDTLRPQASPPPPAGHEPLPLPKFVPSPNVLPADMVGVRIRAYLMAGVDEAAYRGFIDRVSAYLQGEGHAVQFIVNEVVLLGAGEPCGWSLGASDLTNCVGPGMGGYIGPPWYRVGLNTSYPYGFDTDWGLHCEAHEFIHYLGVQDLYWLQTDGLSPYQAPAHPWPTEVMLDPYLASPELSSQSSIVIDLNLQKIAQGGSSSIVSVRTRMPTALTVQTPAGYQSCQVFIRERRYDTFRSRMLAGSSLTLSANATGGFSLPAIGGDSADNNFDIYRVLCPSGEYWIHSRSAESAYFEYEWLSDPILRCDQAGQWCTLMEEPLLLRIFLPMLLR